MDLEYRLDGDSTLPLLVLSNSLGTTWEMWQAQLPALTQHFRVLRYNTRGHGRSPLTQHDLSLATLGQDVISLLNHLGVERAFFCGISLGGLTGLWLNRHAGGVFIVWWWQTPPPESAKQTGGCSAQTWCASRVWRPWLPALPTAGLRQHFVRLIRRWWKIW
jgi:hypothetical protein